MLPASLIRRSDSQIAEALAKTAMLSRQKRAASSWQELATSALASPAAIGVAGGTALGGLSSLTDKNRRKQLLRNMLMGGVAGGGLGLAYGLGSRGLQAVRESSLPIASDVSSQARIDAAAAADSAMIPRLKSPREVLKGRDNQPSGPAGSPGPPVTSDKELFAGLAGAAAGETGYRGLMAGRRNPGNWLLGGRVREQLAAAISKNEPGMAGLRPYFTSPDLATGKQVRELWKKDPLTRATAARRAVGVGPTSIREVLKSRAKALQPPPRIGSLGTLGRGTGFGLLSAYLTNLYRQRLEQRYLDEFAKQLGNTTGK